MKNTDKVIHLLKQAQVQRARNEYIYSSKLKAQVALERVNKEVRKKYTEL